MKIFNTRIRLQYVYCGYLGGSKTVGRIILTKDSMPGIATMKEIIQGVLERGIISQDYCAVHKVIEISYTNSSKVHYIVLKTWDKWDAAIDRKTYKIDHKLLFTYEE